MKQLGIVLTLLLLARFHIAYGEDNNWRQRTTASGAITTYEDVDIAEEVRFGREVAARMLGRYNLYTDPQLIKYINLVGNAVATNNKRAEISYRFAILDTDEINAYAAPGGYIFITKGALSNMQDEAELAGVIAHEIIHVSERHIVKELNIHSSSTSAVAGFARLIGGGSETAKVAFAQAVDKAIDILVKDGYKKEDEFQADTASIVLAALSGYDPTGLPRYIDRVSVLKTMDTAVLNKTHPGYGDRIANMKKTITSEKLEGSKFLINKNRFAQYYKKIQ